MKKLIILLFIFISSVINATTWYVSPSGNDSGTGTISDPWRTWGKAFNWEAISPRDTVYFRGGVYMKNLADGDDDWYYPNRSDNGIGYRVSRAGTAGNIVCYYAYPGEIPILDCGNTDPDPVTSLNHGIRGGANYAHFKGLVIRNVYQRDAVNLDDQCFGWTTGGLYTTIENCTIYNINGIGFQSYGGSPMSYINCDAYECYDPLWPTPGNRGTGFAVLNTESTTRTTYFKYCRAWRCGDQGFATNDLAYTEYEGCWSFNNGRVGSAGGHGFKFGLNYTIATQLQRTYKNCIAAYNRLDGFTTNDNNIVPNQINVYNNTAYLNGSAGFRIFNTSQSDAQELLRVYRNNLAYNNLYNIYLETNATYTHSTNSWDTPPGATVTNADFISIDSTGITASRQSDGSLPNNDCYNNFLNLMSSSDLINSGTDVGLDYIGIAPDLGYVEYDEIPSLTAYYVSTSGNDSNDGSFDNPWLTWDYAFETAIAGDTVYFMGGVYYTTSYIGTSNKHGTAANPICYFNYPGEVPILDGINKLSNSTGLGFSNCSYINFQGLTVRNNLQIAALSQPHGIELSLCSHITMTNCVVYNNGYRGFYIYNPDSLYFYNCDSYNNADTLSAAPGNGGDGFIATGTHNEVDTLQYVYFRGCRSWHNSDDGWDVNIEGTVELDSCWSFRNGYLVSGNGMGFKLSLSEYRPRLITARVLTHNIAFDNESNGFTTNDNGHLARPMHIYNNTAYRNGLYGYYIFNCDPTSSNTEELIRVFKNNISYANVSGSVYASPGYAYYTHDHNTWDIPITVTNNDFISIDTLGVSGSRQSNGSLPNLDFLKLSSISSCINVGIDVGLDFNGLLPDLGAFEYEEQVLKYIYKLTKPIYNYSTGKQIVIRY